MTDLQAKLDALPEWPERENMPTRKLPYLQTSAPCMICAALVSGDFGLVPNICDGCYNHALYRYERRRADAALARLALAREWIDGAPHAIKCPWERWTGCADALKPPCTCGRDALLKALEVDNG